jgi:hypothetical protein
MNKAQMLVLWIAGLLVSGILCNTGIKLLRHAAANKDVFETGYPFTLVIGTAWTFIAPIIIVGVLLAVSLKGKK